MSATQAAIDDLLLVWAKQPPTTAAWGVTDAPDVMTVESVTASTTIVKKRIYSGMVTEVVHQQPIEQIACYLTLSCIVI